LTCCRFPVLLICIGGITCSEMTSRQNGLSPGFVNNHSRMTLEEARQLIVDGIN
jgi:hypothetical protein